MMAQAITRIAFATLGAASLLTGSASTGQEAEQNLMRDTFDRADIAPWTTRYRPAQFTIVGGQLRGEHLDPGHSATSHAFYAPTGDLRFSFHARMEDVEAFTMHVGDSKAMETVHFGHLARAQFRGEDVLISDDFTGWFKLENRALPPDERRAATQAMRVRGPMPLSIHDGAWHHFTFEFRGDLARVFVDGQQVIEHRSEGFAHPYKNRISFNVLEGVAYFDNVRVTRL